MRLIRRFTAEAWLAMAMAVVAFGGLLFMPYLVAEPKILFGRSLTAIEPNLFPQLVLLGLAALTLTLLWMLRHRLLSADEPGVASIGALRVVLLFGVMIFYALAMGPLGFFISSAMSMAAISWIAGNHSLAQIAAISIICPIGLYLVSTRGLAVSLPELSTIEFAYAAVFNQ